MNFPWERFVRFVISTKADPNTVLRRMRLPTMAWEATVLRRTKLRNAPRPPIVDAWFNGKDAPIAGSEAFLTWARTNEIAELWERRPEFQKPDSDVEAACRLFCNPGLRTVAGTLLLAGFTKTEIREFVYTQYDVELAERAVWAFGHLFWDQAFLTREDWAALLEDLDKDQRHLLMLAFSGRKKAYVRCALGGVPEVDYSDILSQITATAHMRFQALMDEPVPDDGAAQAWARLAMTAGEKHKRYGGGPKKSVAEELQLALRHTDAKLPTLADLGIGPVTPAKKPES
jgi:hypothetical protein